MSNPLVVGVDVHRQTNTVAMMNSQGQEVTPRFTIDNNRPGCETFVQQVAQQVIAGDFDAIHLAAEATGWYWFHFFQALSQAPLLSQWSPQLYPFNPRLTAHFKKTYVDLDHTDDIDAVVIADRLRLGRDLPAPFHSDAIFLPLRCLTRYRYHVVHDLAREKSYCLAVLYLKCSEYSHPVKKPFTDVFGAASRAVMQDFASIEDIAALPFDQLMEFIDAKGKRRFPDPADNTRKLQQVARDSYSLPATLQPPINLILNLSLQHITCLEHQEKRLNTAISDLMQAGPNTLHTIPGLGSVLASGISSEIGDIQRFAGNQAKVAKYAGFKWHKHQSAAFQAEDTHLTRTGNPYLRYYLCEAANSVRVHDAEYAAYYDAKCREVRTHQHKRAIVLTARKLVRLVVRLLTTNQPYQPRRC